MVHTPSFFAGFKVDLDCFFAFSPRYSFASQSGHRRNSCGINAPHLHLCNSTMYHLLSCYIHTARRHLCRCPSQCSEGRGNGNKKATAHFCTIASCNFPRYQFTSFIPPLKPQLFPNFFPKRKAKRISFYIFQRHLSRITSLTFS